MSVVVKVVHTENGVRVPRCCFYEGSENLEKFIFKISTVFHIADINPVCLYYE
eukprot:Pgem_evm1s9392